MRIEWRFLGINIHNNSEIYRAVFEHDEKMDCKDFEISKSQLRLGVDKVNILSDFEKQIREQYGN